MFWVSWRLQRTETLIAAGILALIAALLIPTGLDMASAYHHDGLAACLGQNTSDTCDQAVHGFASRFDGLKNLLAWFTLVPGVIGVLFAAPFILELENGTTRLAWTQSITRRRWITNKLAIIVGAALLAAVVLTLLNVWWHKPLVRLDGRMENSIYDAEGVVPVGYTLFALGLALAVGAVWRRTVPAVIVGFVGYFAVRIFFDTWLRQRVVSPLTATWLDQPSPGRRFPGPNLNHAWVISQGPSDKLGHPLGLSALSPCVRAVGGNGKAGSGDCLAQHGGGYMHAVFEPASRFWTLQGVETGIFAGAALLMILFAAWWTHRRAA
jgi:hypothetical protein